MIKKGNELNCKAVVLVTGIETKLSHDLAVIFARRKMKVMVQSDAEDNKFIIDSLINDNLPKGEEILPCYYPIYHTTGIMKDFINQFDRLDILIVKIPDGYDFGDWKSDYEYQLQIVYRLVYKFMEYFQNQKFGRIIFIASHQGISDSLSSVTFNSAKFALLGLCHSLAVVGKSNNISCNMLLVEDFDKHKITDSIYEKNKENIELIMNLTKANSTETGTILSSKEKLLCLKEFIKKQPLVVALNDEALIGQVAIVTGSSSGIGFYLVKMLLKMGAIVIAYENNMLRQWSRPNFEQTKENKRRSINLLGSKKNHSVKSSKLEFIDFMDESQLIDFVMNRHGRIDILFNTSTVPIAPRHSELHEYSWELMLRHRLESAYDLSQLVLPIMQKQRYGRIIFSGPNLCCESIRYGLIGLVKGISESLECFKHNIKANSLFVDSFDDFNAGNDAAFLACQLIMPFTPFQNQAFEIKNETLAEICFQYHSLADLRHYPLAPCIKEINYPSCSKSSLDSMPLDQ